MKLGVYVRNMGDGATRELLLASARRAEAAGIDDLWVADHVAIPKDQSEGSNGRYLDPLATLAFLAAATERIGLGTGVLVLPYRSTLATAKWIATIQELSGGRLLLGVGVGWMKPEFRAAGVRLEDRGRISEEILDFLDRAFSAEDDEVELHGQRFLFRPNPPRPPIFVGGAPPHAFRRAVRFGAGWMPMGLDADGLREPAAELRRLSREAGRPDPEIVVLRPLAVDDPPKARDQLAALEDAGATRVVAISRYADETGFARLVDGLSALR